MTPASTTRAGLARWRRPGTVALAAVLATSGGAAVALSSAAADPVRRPAVPVAPAEQGKGWTQPVQDAQPNPRAARPEQRGRWATAQERRERVRPEGPADLPPARAGRTLVTDPVEVAR